MASQEIREAAGKGDQPPCKVAGLFLKDTDIIVETESCNELFPKLSGIIIHRVLNGPAKYRGCIYGRKGQLQEEVFFNTTIDRPVWRKTQWHENGLIARLCGYNNNGHYHGTFLTICSTGRIKTNHVMMNGRRVYEYDFYRPCNDDQVFVAIALANDVKKLNKSIFNNPDEEDTTIN
jgi:hypothetical protein